MKKPIVSAIVAMDRNRGIGKTELGVGKILWRIKDDLVRLKNLTKDHVVILGRKTYNSMAWYYDKSGRSMPGKLYVVITHDKNYRPTRENAIAAGSIEGALEIARKNEPDEIFINGGAQIYEQSLPYVDRLYLTLVDNEYDVDTYFPDYSDFKKEVSREDRENEEGLKYTWLTLDRQ